MRRKKSQGPKKPAAVETSPEALEEIWKVVEEEVRGSGFQLSESLTEGLVPFDAASETPLEDQRAEAMVRVQDALLARQGPVALGLLRAARSARRNTTQYCVFKHPHLPCTHNIWSSLAAFPLHLQ